jgi:ankyrin repeat protein
LGYIKKYKLTGNSLLELEKALRNAVANNQIDQIDDVKFLCSPLIKLDINAAGPLSGKTALHVAAEKNHIEIIKFLLEKSADSTRRDKDGKIPEGYVTTEACKGSAKEPPKSIA